MNVYYVCINISVYISMYEYVIDLIYIFFNTYLNNKNTILFQCSLMSCIIKKILLHQKRSRLIHVDFYHDDDSF